MSRHQMANQLTLDFFDSARVGDVDGILEYIHDGYDVNEVILYEEMEEDVGPVSALMVASKYGHVDCVESLLQFGADISRITQYYTKALLYASHKNLPGRLRQLSLAGLYRDEGDKLRDKDLISSTQHGAFDKVHRLLSGTEGADHIVDVGKVANVLSFLILSGCPASCLWPLMGGQGNVINGRNCRGFTPLISAIVAGRKECIDVLMENGADVNTPEDVGPTDDFECVWVADELKFAEAFGHASVLNSNRKCPLMYAVWTGKVEIVKHLLELNADVSSTDSQLMTPLIHAVYAGHEGIVDMLLSHGADVNYRNYETHKTVLYHAVNAGDTSEEIVKMLLNAGANPCDSDGSGKSSLFFAAETGQESIMTIFLKNEGIDINWIDNPRNKKTVLMQSVGMAMFNSVQLLINSGADLDLKDERGNTATEIAAQCSDLKCFKLLLENVKNFHIDKALHLAARNTDSDVLQFCLDESATNINLVDEDGDTPLMCAVQEGIIDNVKLLMGHGVDINFKNRSGMTAVIYAVQFDELECFDFLIRAGADVSHDVSKDEIDSLLILATEKEDVYYLKILLEKGGHHVNYLSKDCGKTALISAIVNKREEFVRLLMIHGADVNIADVRGRTPIMHACQRMSPNWVQVLLDAGANVNVADENGETVLVDALNSWKRLDILLKDGSVLEDNSRKLRSIHTEDGISLCFKWNTRCLLLLFEYGMFEWDWFVYGEQIDQIDKISFAAVSAGNSPSLFEKNGKMTSLLQEAFLGNDRLTARYLLANLYLTIEDYRCITDDQKLQQRMREDEDVAPETLSLLQCLTSQPWRLETLSFLTVSSSLTLSDDDPGQKRAEKVDSLMLPEMFKSKLKFEGSLAQLCPSQWESIGVLPSGDEQDFLNISKPLYPYANKLMDCAGDNCDNCDDCQCCGFRLTSYDMLK